MRCYNRFVGKVTREELLKFRKRLDTDKGKKGILTIPVKISVYERSTNTLLEEEDHTVTEWMHESVYTFFSMKAAYDNIPLDEALLLFVRAYAAWSIQALINASPTLRFDITVNGKHTWVAADKEDTDTPSLRNTTGKPHLHKP